MKSITGVLEHLGGAQRNAADGTQRCVHARHLLHRTRIVAAHHNQRRMHEILDGIALAQELGIKDHG